MDHRFDALTELLDQFQREHGLTRDEVIDLLLEIAEAFSDHQVVVLRD